jgi:hypothetical protein
VRIWDAAARTAVATLEGHTGWVRTTTINGPDRIEVTEDVAIRAKSRRLL